MAGFQTACVHEPTPKSSWLGSQKQSRSSNGAASAATWQATSERSCPDARALEDGQLETYRDPIANHPASRVFTPPVPLYHAVWAQEHVCHMASYRCNCTGACNPLHGSPSKCPRAVPKMEAAGALQKPHARAFLQRKGLKT